MRPDIDSIKARCEAAKLGAAAEGRAQLTSLGSYVGRAMP
jgi:hypothetical protein